MRVMRLDVAHAERVGEPDEVWRPAGNHSSGPKPTSAAATPPTASLTPYPTDFEDIWSDSASEHSDDWSDVAEDYHVVEPAWSAHNAPAMAEDFSEGRLETLVGSPQKELAGTQNAYVSYLVSTKVQHLSEPCTGPRRNRTDAHTPAV